MKKLQTILLSILFLSNMCFALTFPIDFNDCKQIGKMIVLTGWFHEVRVYGEHQSYDIPANQGVDIKSCELGEVIKTGFEYPKYDSVHKIWRSGYGNYIDIGYFDIIKTPIGEIKRMKYFYRYAHMEKPASTVGDPIYEGQKIGEVGATGIVDLQGRPIKAFHLHMEKRLPNGVKIPCLSNFTPLVQKYFGIETKKVFATIGSKTSNN